MFGPSPFELHADHRAAFDAIARAGQSRPSVRAFLWGVNSPAPRDFLIDITAVRSEKGLALASHRTQDPGGSLSQKIEALDRGATINVDLEHVYAVEAFTERRAADLSAYGALVAQIMIPNPTTADPVAPSSKPVPQSTAVLTAFNKRDDVRENLAAIYKQTLPFARVIVVDNSSGDGTAAMIREEFPDVHLVVMPHSNYGACETFNVGFASSDTEFTAILDDDIVMPPDWLAKTTARMLAEPDTTAIVSTKVVEPGMPDSYKNSDAINTERYMSTFRGCASLARTNALREANYYDERLFIYGNERDLTCRLLNRGYRVAAVPRGRGVPQDAVWHQAWAAQLVLPRSERLADHVEVRAAGGPVPVAVPRSVPSGLPRVQRRSERGSHGRYRHDWDRVFVARHARSIGNRDESGGLGPLERSLLLEASRTRECRRLRTAARLTSTLHERLCRHLQLQRRGALARLLGRPLPNARRGVGGAARRQRINGPEFGGRGA